MSKNSAVALSIVGTLSVVGLAGAVHRASEQPPRGSFAAQPDGPELGESVARDEATFGQPEFDSPGDADVLARPVRGYKLIGYKNSVGITCMAYTGALRSATCLPSPDYVFPEGGLYVRGLNPEDSYLEKGKQEGEPITYGTAPAGTDRVVLQRAGEASVAVKAFRGGKKYRDQTFFLAPFDFKTKALTIMAYSKDGTQLASKSLPERPAG